ncbi:hypothetical protein [Paenibacillus xylanexedens]|uniref:hypothetical protein n=1 Tax=Paenibacillus xylanexedens TaxID=528191 RepID=UPI00119EA3A4|nr:hypothetical protein [Paenibacillus xylanexedens]
MTPEDLRITRHARQRTKDRLGLKKKLSGKKADEAFEYGVRRSDATGRLARYLDALYFRGHIANNIRIYHRYVYLFNDRTLITILHLPKEYIPAADKAQKRKGANSNVCEN